MENALVVSCTDKGIAFFTQLLTAAGIHQIVALPSCSEARRTLLERDFDLVVINAPLRDETGERFAREVSSKGLSQVILVVKAEYHNAVSSVSEDDGVLTLSKPINAELFWASLKLLKSVQNKLRRAYEETERLKQKIEDIRIVDRAKYVLISYMNMTEQDAHRYIEKQAMDMRCTKRIIAERLLRTYEN